MIPIINISPDSWCQVVEERIFCNWWMEGTDQTPWTVITSRGPVVLKVNWLLSETHPRHISHHISLHGILLTVMKTDTPSELNVKQCLLPD